MKFIAELRRRGVLQTLAGYVGLVWLIVQVLETTLSAFDLPESVIRWVIVGAAILLLPILAASWIFQWSPTGLTTQAQLDSADTQQSGGVQSRRLDLIVIAILALAVTYFAVDKFVLEPGTLPSNSIAVVPFQYVPTNQDRAYISYGIAADVLSMLAGNVALRMAPRSVSFNKAADESTLDFARNLGVSYVLDGTVREQGDRLRVSVELLSTQDGLSVWGTAEDTSEAQLFRIVDKISKAVEGHLNVDPQAESERHVPHPDAYRKRLSAVYQLSPWNEANALTALALIREALEIDPEYLTAWSNLGSITLNAANTGFISREVAYREIKEVVLNMLTLAPSTAEGYRLAGRVAMNYEADMAAAIENLQRAIEFEPHNLVVLTDVAVLLMQMGRLEEAIALDEYVVSRSPFDAISARNLALKYLYADRLQEALAMQQRNLAIDPSQVNGQYWLGEIYLLMGDLDSAAAAFDREVDAAYRIKARALLASAKGDNQARDTAIAQLIQEFGDQWPSEVAHLYAYSGQTALAFEWLERELAAYGPGGWGEWQLQRLYDNLRDTDEWRQFLTRLEVHESQLQKLRFEVDLEPYR